MESIQTKRAELLKKIIELVDLKPDVVGMDDFVLGAILREIKLRKIFQIKGKKFHNLVNIEELDEEEDISDDEDFD